MRINNNLMAMNTHRQLGINANNGSKSIEKLSSGYRINRAGDDAAGLAISEKMRGQIRGLTQASRNSQDAISLVQTAEGALNETQAILQRMRELAVQSATDTNVNVDRDALQNEINELATEITRISDTTEFNTQGLLDGKFKGTFHIGANEGQNMQLQINEMSSQALKVSGSGEGKATYEVELATGTAGTTNESLVSGEQTLSVTQLDNVTVGNGSLHANYGLLDDSGEVVAVSNDGDIYTFLTEATKKGDLGTATLSDSSLNFADKVLSGEVTLEATLNATTGMATAITDIKATSSVNVDGLASGDYTLIDINAGNFSTYFASTATDGKITVAAANGIADGDIGFALLDSDGKIAAVEFTGHLNSMYAVGDVDFTQANAVAATRITAAIGTAEAAMTKGAAFAASDKFSIKADGGIDISTQETASAAITTINDALESVSKERAKLGAVQNRLEHTIKNLDTSAENLQASESRIRDVDMAKEMMEFTKNNILQQAAQAMLAQANQAPQGVLQLLR